MNTSTNLSENIQLVNDEYSRPAKNISMKELLGSVGQLFIF